MKTATILGAGPSGLVSALFLARKGWHVKIYEKANIVGGMCRSWRWNNFILDTGPHIFHTSNKQLWRFWKKNFESS